MMLIWLQRFGAKTCNRTSAQDGTSLKQRVANLEDILRKLSTDLTTLVNSPPNQNININIDNLNVEKVNLDQLLFDIEGIGVKDLSGSLSIGVNLNAKTDSLKLPEAKKPKQPIQKKSATSKKGDVKGSKNPNVNLFYNP